MRHRHWPKTTNLVEPGHRSDLSYDLLTLLSFWLTV
jgi:hypothetical protein